MTTSTATAMKRFNNLCALLLLLLLSCKQETYYNVTTNAQPAEGGSVAMTPSSNTVLEGTTVTFTAQPKGEYVFTGWSGGLTGTDNPKTITVSTDLSITANFTLRSYPLTLSVEGEGTVSENVISTKTDYSSGTVVELTAKPADHWLFDHWEGDLNGNTNPVQITLSSAKTVKAVFVKKMYDLTVDVEGEGSVSETVVETKSGSFLEGTTVELTATPGTGWSFDHWEGDLVGEDNPARITITSAKTVKAVFAKKQYAYNLKIIGPGVVDEYLLEDTADTKATLAHGTKVLLKAIPSDGAYFKGWSGSLSGIETDVIVDIDQVKDITATFVTKARTDPLPDLLAPSVKSKLLYYGVDFSSFTFHPAGFYSCDYNRDGYVDVVGFGWDVDVCSPLEFYLGTADGGFMIDEKNHERFMGQIGCSRTLMGDFNKDGDEDFFFIGAGYDVPDTEGEYNILLLSNGVGGFIEFRLEQFVGRFTSGGSADIDNDGDLDVFVIEPTNNHRSLLLINDGKGKFSDASKRLNHDLIEGKYHGDVFDVDGDGFCDLILGHADFNQDDETVVVWGNGEHFNGEVTGLPKSEVLGMGLIIDNYFFDIDGDGKEELLRIRTGDPVYGNNYIGWALQVIKIEGRSFFDITSSCMDLGDAFNLVEEPYVALIAVEEIEGRYFIVGRQTVNARLLFELKNGKLIKVVPEKQSPTHGMPLICEGIHLEGWKQWDGINIPFNESMMNGADLSYLKDNGYALEFFIKNEDPSLRIDIKFESFINQETWKPATYFYGYDASEHPMEGTWERVVVPLDRLDDWTDKAQNYWSMLDHVHFQVSSTGGQPFSLKDIRIRKVLPE